MKVAMLHFHLRRGGVGSVMHRQAASLALTQDPPELAFVVGAAAEGRSPAPVFVVPGLDYDSFTGADAADLEAGARRLAAGIEDALSRAFPGGCDLLHVHNPLLRKNARLLGALGILQSRGHALLVQEHDFAEDYRPDVYDSAWPYPEACDYATINSRDRDSLVAAGLDPGHVHLLPNPIADDGAFSPRGGFAMEAAKGRRTVLYPVRAIRRKNLGEALLLSLFLPEGAELAVTLPPTSEGDRPSYQAWKAFAAKEGLPVRFGAGEGATLPELFATSFAVVTTSVKEGFGYSYLDPLMRGIPVLGREIPHIARDFRENGIGFPGLYPAIPVPVTAAEREDTRAAADARLARFREAFRPAFGPDGEARLEALLEALPRRFEGELLDFGALDQQTQASVLARLKGDGGFAAELVGLNPFLGRLFTRAPSAEEALLGREAVVRSYSDRRCGELLSAAYGRALRREARGRVDKAVLLERYLRPAAFFLSAS
ncbi:MAG: hypothetical protein JNG85_00555 [Spirochaetaceae bacterium]|nr:hypothetical protein [Spirochaetaceae bacterium]